MISSTQLQAVFFDFDGVIADSLAVKKNAFVTLFAPWGKAVQTAAVRYHEANGGMPRHSKLRHCMEVLAGQKISEAELAALVRRFAELVFDAVVAAPLLPRVEQTLQALLQAQIPAFVVSGTPEEEMQRIVRHKKLEPYFQAVFGAPRQKSVIVQKVLSRYTFSPQYCLFIGDALADFKAARTCGLAFLGIVPQGGPNIFPADVAISPDPGHQHWPRLLGQSFALP